MVTPDSINEAVGQFFNSSVLSQVIMWTGYIFVAIIILTVFIVLYYWIQYKYKVTYPVLHYSKDGNSAQILKFKSDRARIIKKNGIRKTHFLFKRKYTEPLTDKIINPGNKVNLLRINDDGSLTPMPPLTFDSAEQFEHLTPEAKTWAILELKETATANETPEAAKRILVYSLITVVFCLIAAVVAVWLIMKAPNQAIDAVNKLTPVLQNIGSSISGVAPN